MEILFYLYKIAKSFYNCYTTVKNKFTIVLLLILALAVYNSNAQRLYDPYFREPLPLTAPEWMKQIEKNPSGVNFHEMQRLFNEWKAVDVDARVKTVENKPAVNFYRRWMAGEITTIDVSATNPTVCLWVQAVSFG